MPERRTLWREPRRIVALVLLVDGFALGAAGLAATWGSFTGSDLLRLGLLVTMSLLYFEVSRQVERSRWFLRVEPSHTNMTSVWALAAAVVLPASLALGLVGVMYLHLWLRSRSGDRDVRLYRFVYSAAAVVLACLAISATLRAAGLSGRPGLSGLGCLAAVAIGAAIYRVVNRSLVSVAIVTSGGRPTRRTLFGSRAENALEFATLALGGVTAGCLLGEPWFAAMVLPAVFLLQHHALIRQLVDAATKDAKTELLNAAAWRRLAEQELTRAERQRSAAAVLVLDMDHFKRTNDLYGHLAGDAALRAVGAALSDELRGYDAVGRFGGEEFVAVLPGVGAADGTRVADRIRARIAGLRVAVQPAAAERDELALTASVGVAAFPEHGDDLDDLLNAADSALFAAKHAGRNATRLADTAMLRSA